MENGIFHVLYTSRKQARRINEITRRRKRGERKRWMKETGRTRARCICIINFSHAQTGTFSPGWKKKKRKKTNGIVTPRVTRHIAPTFLENVAAIVAGRENRWLERRGARLARKCCTRYARENGRKGTRTIFNGTPGKRRFCCEFLVCKTGGWICVWVMRGRARGLFENIGNVWRIACSKLHRYKRKMELKNTDRMGVVFSDFDGQP